jgi:hypothetical protein
MPNGGRVLSEQPTAVPSDELTWEIEIPLLSNRVILGGLVRVFAITGGIMCLLMAVLFGAQGDWELIAPVSLALLVGCLGLFLLCLVVMVAVFRNRMRFRFTVSADGVRAETIDPTVKLVNRLSIGAGAFGGSPGTAGAGLINASRETEEALWSGSFSARYDDRAHTVVLRNAWRGLLYVYCTPEVYPLVVARMKREIEANGTAKRVAKRSPLAANMALSAGVAVACLPAFAMVEALGMPLLVPVILLCFALAMVWLVGAFGWVVLAMMALQSALVALDALSIRQSFMPGQTYVRWTVFSGDDWALIALTLAAFAFLGWLSVRAILGKRRSVLDADFADMGQ